jgi:F-type H+-transporting ATPase subunit b
LEEVLKIINPMTSTIFWSIIVFVILLVVLLKFVLKPVNRMLTKRQEDIRQAVDSAEKQKEEALQYIEEQKLAMDDARKTARELIEESKQTARKVKDEIEEKANKKSRQIVQSAMEEIKLEKERSVAAVKNQIIDIAMEAAQKIVGKTLTEKDHKKIIEESLKEVSKI